MSGNQVSHQSPKASPSHSAGCSQEEAKKRKSEVEEIKELISSLTASQNALQNGPDGGKSNDNQPENLEKMIEEKQTKCMEKKKRCLGCCTRTAKCCQSQNSKDTHRMSATKERSLILCLSKQSIDFLQKRCCKTKKNAFKSKLENCVLTEHVLVVASTEMEGYLTKLKKDRKSKLSQFLFFKTDEAKMLNTLQQNSKKWKAPLVFMIKDGEQKIFSPPSEHLLLIVIKDSYKPEDQAIGSVPKGDENLHGKSSVDILGTLLNQHQHSQAIPSEKTPETSTSDSDKRKFFDISSNFDTKTTLSELILDLIEEKCTSMKYMYLALSWGCSKKAQEKMKKDKKLTECELRDLMEKALIQDMHTIVPAFMMRDISLDGFLKLPHSTNLYKEAKENDLFKKLKKEKADDNKQYKEIIVLVRDRIEFIRNGNKDKETNSKPRTEPELFLFFWALLTMKFELAKVLLKEVKDSMTTSLVACALLKDIQNRTMEDVDFQDEQEDIKKNIEEFESLAIDALKTLYEKNQEMTYRLLRRIQNTDYWSKVTCWEIAEHARCRKFIAQEACQNFADAIWEGRLSLHNKASTGSVIFTRIVYFFCAIFVIVPQWIITCSQYKRGQAQWNQFVSSWPRSFFNPSFKFYSRWFFFNGFLLLYAYVLMVRVPPNDVQPSEIFLMIWFLLMFIDEVCMSVEMVRRRKHLLSLMFFMQLGILNITNYHLGSIGIFVWLCSSNDTYLHIILCLNFAGFILRFFHFLAISSHLGTKIFMIKRMIMEIILFFVILMISFITYGIIKYSLDNKGGVVNSTVVLALPVEPFWMMLGNKPDNDDNENDDDPLVIFRGIVRVAYCMITAVLLINVLIAAFNALYQRIDDQKQDVRKFQKFQTIVKYSNASVFPPPLNFFSIVCCLICFLKLQFGSKSSKHANMDKDEFRVVMENDKEEKLLRQAEIIVQSSKEETPKTFEELIKEFMEDVIQKQEKEKEESTDENNGSDESMKEHIKRLEDEVIRAKNQAAADTATLSQLINELKKLGGSPSEGLKSVAETPEITQHLGDPNTANLPRGSNESNVGSDSHNERLTRVTKLDKRRHTVCETCDTYGSCIVCGKFLKLIPILDFPKTT